MTNFLVFAFYSWKVDESGDDHMDTLSVKVEVIKYREVVAAMCRENGVWVASELEVSGFAEF